MGSDNDYSSSKMYMDDYGMIYMAGTSDYWCVGSGLYSNSWVVFKNNIEMGLFEGVPTDSVYLSWDM